MCLSIVFVTVMSLILSRLTIDFLPPWSPGGFLFTLLLVDPVLDSVVDSVFGSGSGSARGYPRAMLAVFSPVMI